MYKGNERDPTKLLILCLVTCNIFTMYWIYQTTQELNRALSRDVFKPALVVVTSILFPPIGWFWLWRLARLLPELHTSRHLPPTGNATVIGVVMILMAPVGVLLFQQELNRVWAATAGN